MKLNPKIDKLAALRMEAIKSRAARLGLGPTLVSGARTLHGWGFPSEQFDIEIDVADASEEVLRGNAVATSEDNIHIVYRVDVGGSETLELRSHLGSGHLHYEGSPIHDAEELWEVVEEHLSEVALRQDGTNA